MSKVDEAAGAVFIYRAFFYVHFLSKEELTEIRKDVPGFNEGGIIYV
ncbi:MAG: hypothetical protein II123_06370 [Lachnospiraceae bacterium]|nr:hypothetical protein [Lachnospiraceae bacterium]